MGIPNDISTTVRRRLSDPAELDNLWLATRTGFEEEDPVVGYSEEIARLLPGCSRLSVVFNSDYSRMPGMYRNTALIAICQRALAEHDLFFVCEDAYPEEGLCPVEPHGTLCPDEQYWLVDSSGDSCGQGWMWALLGGYWGDFYGEDQLLLDMHMPTERIEAVLTTLSRYCQEQAVEYRDAGDAGVYRRAPSRKRLLNWVRKILN